MSYSVNNNCGNCEYREKCRDCDLINNAVYEIHSLNDGSHLGFGQIEINCYKNKKSNYMSFGKAINFMRQGFKVAREGWNGKGMFIYIQDGTTITKDQARNKILSQIESDIKINPHIDMKSADGSIVVGWLASQADMLSNDWKIVE